MEYKSLYICREGLQLFLENEIHDKGHAPEIKIPNEYGITVKTVYQGKELGFRISYTKDGKCTLTANGEQTDLHEKIFSTAKERYLLGTGKPFTESFPLISQESFSNFVELAKEDPAIANVEETKVNNGTKVTLTSKYGDSANIIFYDTRKLLLQGKDSLAGNTALGLIFAQFEPKSIDEFVRSKVTVPISFDQAIEHAKTRLGNADNLLDDSVIERMAVALVLDRITLDIPDYGSYCFPALRGLEGYFRALIKGIDGTFRAPKQIGLMFDGANDDPGEDIKNKIPESKRRDILRKLYRYMKMQRHTSFHEDNEPNMTRVLSREDAVKIIDSCFRQIRESYDDWVDAKQQ